MTVTGEILLILAVNSCFLLYSIRFDAFQQLQGQPVVATVLGQVQATDADSGTFGQIEYSLSAPSNMY